jgi:protein-S-isoprenylcysteine O-methyltransferase Ste14
VAGLLLLIPLFWVLETRFVRPEEARLSSAFGEDYEAYRRRVRRWL